MSAASLNCRGSLQVRADFGVDKRSCDLASVQLSSQANASKLKSGPSFSSLTVRVASKDNEPEKESLFTSITNALDFAAVRSEEDAQLIQDARAATRIGERMSREQYAALRRKVGGTAKSYFKEWIDVDGEYVDEGWVDKTCRYCKKDTNGEPRTKDAVGRYAHVECQESAKSKSGGNIFAKFFNL